VAGVVLALLIVSPCVPRSEAAADQAIIYESGRYCYENLTWAGGEWYGSPYWTGPDWTRVGRDWHHSGENVASVRVFAAPRSGTVHITGRLYKLDTKGGDGVCAAIRCRGQTIWSAGIDAADATGVEPALTVGVITGDTLRFALSRRGNIICDTTHWDPLITYDDGARYQASEGFSDQAGLWSYQMEVDAGPQAWEVVQQRHPGGQGDLQVSRGTSESPEQVVRFQGLRPEAIYLVSEASGADETRRTGEDLLRSGFPLALPYEGRLTLRYRPDEGGVKTSPPPPPQSLTVRSVGPTTIELTWPPVPEARSYLIFRDGDLLERRTGRRGFPTDAPVGSPVGKPLRPVFRSTLLPGQTSRYAVCSERGFLRSEPVCASATASGRGPLSRRPDMDLWELIEADWMLQDHIGDTPDSYVRTTAKALADARALANRLSGVDLTRERAELARLADLKPPTDRNGQRALYLAARWLKRRAALSNPLLSRPPRVGRASLPVTLLFVKRVPTSYSHLVMQYFGWRARPGGGLHLLEEPGWSTRTRDLLHGSLRGGSVFAPRLSWDARRVVFSYSHCTGADPWFHIYEVGTGGSALRQLTSGPYEDLMPAYLPDGGIVFSSTRRRGYARCFGAQFSDRWHVYTLHCMDADGSNLRTLSFHETNEWFPSVLHDGTILYARWDYVDRHAVLHQNLWRTNPDGTNPVTVYGNQTESPHCLFEAQPVPGSRKIIATASAHHSITAGSIVLVDPDVDYDGPAPIERVTPEVCFPEAEGWPQSYYATPWPLSEDYYLASYSPRPLIPEPNPNEPAALGLYLLDRWGNRELLYRDPAIGSTSPIPVAPRPVPPVLPTTLPREAGDSGAFLLLDVYQGLTGIPRGSVKALRVLQILPKATPVGDVPPIGLAGQEPGRMVLGTVPVESDGSAHFAAPARKPLLFQAIDDRGMAIHTMRSITYLQRGERVSCVGCHERRNTAPVDASPLAARRPPTPIISGPDGCAPFSYPRLVQPVLDRYCISCHGDDKPAGGVGLTGTVEGQWTRSYLALTGGNPFWQDGTTPDNAAKALVPRFGGWNSVHSTPIGGLYGSRGSRLMRLLLDRHQGVELDAQSIARLVIWIDANAIFYGTFDPSEQAGQLRGELIAAPSLQ